MKLDKVTLRVVLRNLHEYDNQLPDTSICFDHQFPRIALLDGNATENSPATAVHLCTACSSSERDNSSSYGKREALNSDDILFRGRIDQCLRYAGNPRDVSITV